MQLAHQIVALEHTAHVECKGKGNGHGQSFGHGHHYKRDRHHEVTQHHLGHTQIIVCMPNRLRENVVTEKNGKCRHGNTGAHLAYHRRQTVELHVERRLNRRMFCGVAGHTPYLGGIPHGGHHHTSAAAHHHCRSQHYVGGICGFIVFAVHGGGTRDGLITVVGRHIFIYNGFTGKGRLVYLQVDSLDEPSVGRHLITNFQHHHIAHDNVTAGNLAHTPVAHHLHRLLLTDGSEHVKLSCGITLKIKTYARGKEDGKEDAYRLDKLALNKGKPQRHHRRHKKDAYDGIVEFFQIQPPQRCLRRRGEHVVAMFAAAFCGFRLGKSRYILNASDGLIIHNIHTF